MRDAGKKIMFVLPSLEVGGAERVFINIVNNIAAAEKHLVVFNAATGMRDFLNKDVVLHVLDKTSVRSGMPRLLKTIYRVKPDVIFSTLTHMNFALLLMKPLLPRRCSLIVRETTLPSAILAKSAGRAVLVKALYKYLYRLADAIILPSQPIAQELFYIAPELLHKSHIVPNMVDVTRIRDQAATPPMRSYRKKEQGLLFVCSGRLHTAKGFDLLLEKISALPQTLEWSLTILGEGSERTLLESLIRDHDLEHRVMLYGMAEKPWQVVARADLFLLPSRWEGLPNAALEALAVGTPVLAMNTAGGISDIAKHAGSNVEITDSIDNFITKMALARKLEDTTLRTSLLPDIYLPETVLGQLTQLLQQD